jgi:hypothetical protein
MISRKTLKVIVVVLTVAALVLASAAIALADPLTINVTIDPTGRVTNTGVVTLTGTVSCDVPAVVYIYYVQLRQSVGRKTLLLGYSYPYMPISCPGGTVAWSATVFAQNGRFGGGPAEATISANSCSFYYCQSWQVSQTVKLRGGGK